jgi:hypothetical protein
MGSQHLEEAQLLVLSEAGGQRAKPAAVAGIASASLLDFADAHRRTDPHQCAASSSACEAKWADP